MPKFDFSDPASVVRGFIEQMHAWELLAGIFADGAQARFRPDDDSTLHAEEIRQFELIKQLPHFIAKIFLTQRVRAYVPSTSYSIPPEYDPKREKVTRVIPKSSSQVIVETNRKTNYMGGLREYVVKKQGGIWLIDSANVTLGHKKVKIILV